MIQIQINKQNVSKFLIKNFYVTSKKKKESSANKPPHSSENEKSGLCQKIYKVLYIHIIYMSVFSFEYFDHMMYV